MPVGKSSIIRATNSTVKQEKTVKAEKVEVSYQKSYAETDFESIICKKTFEKADAEQLKSAEKYGIIQPLILCQKEENKFELLSGFENYNIAKQLKLKKIPSIIITCSETDVKQIIKALSYIKTETAEKETKINNKDNKENKDKKELPFYLL